MGTTGKDLTFWLLLSGIAHGLVLGALPPVWTAGSGPSLQELRVHLGAGAASEQSGGGDAPGAQQDVGSASREAPGPASRAANELAREPLAVEDGVLETARAAPAAEAARAKDPGADQAVTEIAARTATANTAAGQTGTREDAPSESPMPDGEGEKAVATSEAKAARGGPPSAHTEVSEIAALVAPSPRTSEEQGATPPEARTPAREEAPAAADARQRAPDAQAAATTDRGASERAEADDPPEASKATGASEQAQTSTQMAAAAARVSAPAFNQSAGGEEAAEELLALLHREISRHKRYPLLARRQQREGKATVRFRLHPDGYVDDVSVVHSSGFRPLDDAALQAVGGVAPFEPAARLLADTERFEVDVVFTLR